MERPEKTPDGREVRLLLWIVRKQSEGKDGGMRELREFFEVVIIWEYFRREGCEKTEVNGNERKKGEREK